MTISKNGADLDNRRSIIKKVQIGMMILLGILYAQEKKEVSGIEFLKGAKAQDLKVVAIERKINSQDTLGYGKDPDSFIFPCADWLDLSPNGKLLADCSPRQIQGIMVRKVNESSGKIIVPKAAKPLWSPDSKWLAYLKWMPIRGKFGQRKDGSRSPVGDTELWVIDTEGKNQKPILTGFECCYYAWSPDGRYIAVSAYCKFPDLNGRLNPFTYLFVIDFAACTKVIIDSLRTEDIPSFSWAPDSRKLAYTGCEEFDTHTAIPIRSDIYIVNADGTGKTQLTFTDEAEDVGKWLPSGDKILISKPSSASEVNEWIILKLGVK